jgi:hypothetical protein
LKYTTYIIIFLFITASILFLKSALKPEELPVFITGSSKCGSCHELKVHGNQYKQWEESKHASAFRSLLTDKAKLYAQQKGLELPEKNELCLKCHTTKVFLKIEDTDVSYNINEGVGCESCHGAGSKYSPAEIMKEHELYVKNGGTEKYEETCYSCHAMKIEKKNQSFNGEVCPFQEKDFDYKSSFEKIKHPLNKESR